MCFNSLVMKRDIITVSVLRGGLFIIGCKRRIKTLELPKREGKHHDDQPTAGFSTVPKSWIHCRGSQTKNFTGFTGQRLLKRLYVCLFNGVLS